MKQSTVQHIWKENMKLEMDYNKLFRKLREPLRFVIVGIIATAIQFGVYLVLLNIVNASIALTIGYLISLACNFLLSTYYTFSTKPTTRKAGGFVLSHVVNWLMQLGTINLFIYMGISKEWAPIPMYIVCMPVNFLMVSFSLKDK